MAAALAPYEMRKQQLVQRYPVSVASVLLAVSIGQFGTAAFGRLQELPALYNKSPLAFRVNYDLLVATFEKKCASAQALLETYDAVTEPQFRKRVLICAMAQVVVDSMQVIQALAVGEPVPALSKSIMDIFDTLRKETCVLADVKRDLDSEVSAPGLQEQEQIPPASSASPSPPSPPFSPSSILVERL